MICNQYFKQNAFNQSYECDDCNSVVLDEVDQETEVDVELLLNPNGKTKAQINYDWDDSHGF